MSIANNKSVIDTSKTVVVQPNQITLSLDQQNFIRQFADWLQQSSDLYFYLLGYAGTGKTYILSQSIVDLVRSNKTDLIYVCAPSHKALNNIKSKVQEKFDIDGINYNECKIDQVTGDRSSNSLKFNTVQKILGFKPIITNDGIKVFESKTKSILLKKSLKQIVFIDECSMLNSDMCDQIVSCSKKFNTKFVFVGDDMQLPPLNEPFSRIFDLVNNETYKYYIQLQTILRTKSDNLMKFTQRIRNWDRSVDINTFLLGLVRDKSIDRSNIKFFNRKLSTFTKSKWFNIFTKKFKQSTHPIIITWRNKIVDTYNTTIRKLLCEDVNQLKFDYIVNDHIIFNNYYFAPDESAFYTSDIAKIIECDHISKDLNRWSQLLIDKPTKSEEVAFNTIVQKMIKRDHVFDVYKMLVVKLLDNQTADLPHCIFTIDRSNNKYKDLIKFITNMIRYYYKTYKDEKLANILWNHYWLTILDLFAEINYSYAITNHKAQGSTFSDVFVDVQDIIQNSNDQEMHKALYTAVTRPANSLYMLL